MIMTIVMMMDNDAFLTCFCSKSSFQVSKGHKGSIFPQGSHEILQVGDIARWDLLSNGFNHLIRLEGDANFSAVFFQTNSHLSLSQSLSAYFHFSLIVIGKSLLFLHKTIK